jgi:hypothetical protein
MIQRILLAFLFTFPLVQFAFAQDDFSERYEFTVAVSMPEPVLIEFRYFGNDVATSLFIEIFYPSPDHPINLLLHEVAFMKIVPDKDVPDHGGRFISDKSILLAAFHVFVTYAADRNTIAFNNRVIDTETGELVYANTLKLKNEFNENTKAEAELEHQRIFDAISKYARARVADDSFKKNKKK